MVKAGSSNHIGMMMRCLLRANEVKGGEVVGRWDARCKQSNTSALSQDSLRLRETKIPSVGFDCSETEWWQVPDPQMVSLTVERKV